MKLNFNAFGFEISIEKPSAYTLLVTSGHVENGSNYQSWDVTATYLGAIYQGWRLARMNAEIDGADYKYVIFRGVRPNVNFSPLRIRTISVTKKVAFFSK